mgnify:FL=1
MSSLIISRIILGAFLAVSLSACSKDSKGSKATVRNKGGQQTGAQKPGTPSLDADAAKAAADKSVDEASKPADESKPTPSDEIISDDDLDSEKTPVISGGGGITVKPLAPKLAVNKPAAPAPAAASVVKPVPVAKPAPTPAPKATPAVTKPAQVPVAKAPAKEESKPAPAKVEAKPQVKSEEKPVVKSAAVIAKPDAKKPAAVTNDNKPAPKKVVTPAKSTSKPAPSVSDKADEAKRLADEKSKADVEREAARRTLVVKTPEDLDKDDTSKENLGSSGYKTIVDQLLAKIEMKSASVVAKIADNNYFSFEQRPVRSVPTLIYDALISSKACDSETSSGCLLIEVSKKNTVVLSYIGTQTKFNEATKRRETFFYRNDISSVDAETQANIEKLSRIAGGKTVVFTSVKTAALEAGSGPLTADAPKN